MDRVGRVKSPTALEPSGVPAAGAGSQALRGDDGRACAVETKISLRYRQPLGRLTNHRPPVRSDLTGLRVDRDLRRRAIGAASSVIAHARPIGQGKAMRKVWIEAALNGPVDRQGDAGGANQLTVTMILELLLESLGRLSCFSHARLSPCEAFQTVRRLFLQLFLQIILYASVSQCEAPTGLGIDLGIGTSFPPYET
jgi:hypothetical protein